MGGSRPRSPPRPARRQGEWRPRSRSPERRPAGERRRSRSAERKRSRSFSRSTERRRSRSRSERRGGSPKGRREEKWRSRPAGGREKRRPSASPARPCDPSGKPKGDARVGGNWRRSRSRERERSRERDRNASSGVINRGAATKHGSSRPGGVRRTDSRPHELHKLPRRPALSSRDQEAALLKARAQEAADEQAAKAKGSSVLNELRAFGGLRSCEDSVSNGAATKEGSERSKMSPLGEEDEGARLSSGHRSASPVQAGPAAASETLDSPALANGKGGEADVSDDADDFKSREVRMEGKGMDGLGEESNMSDASRESGDGQIFGDDADDPSFSDFHGGDVEAGLETNDNENGGEDNWDMDDFNYQHGGFFESVEDEGADLAADDVSGTDQISQLMEFVPGTSAYAPPKPESIPGQKYFKAILPSKSTSDRLVARIMGQVRTLKASPPLSPIGASPALKSTSVKAAAKESEGGKQGNAQYRGKVANDVTKDSEDGSESDEEDSESDGDLLSPAWRHVKIKLAGEHTLSVTRSGLQTRQTNRVASNGVETSQRTDLDEYSPSDSDSDDMNGVNVATPPAREAHAASPAAAAPTSSAPSPVPVAPVVRLKLASVYSYPHGSGSPSSGLDAPEGASDQRHRALTPQPSSAIAERASDPGHALPTPEPAKAPESVSDPGHTAPASQPSKAAESASDPPLDNRFSVSQASNKASSRPAREVYGGKPVSRPARDVYGGKPVSRPVREVHGGKPVTKRLFDMKLAGAQTSGQDSDPDDESQPLVDSLTRRGLTGDASNGVAKGKHEDRRGGTPGSSGVVANARHRADRKTGRRPEAPRERLKGNEGESEESLSDACERSRPGSAQDQKRSTLGSKGSDTNQVEPEHAFKETQGRTPRSADAESVRDECERVANRSKLHGAGRQAAPKGLTQAASANQGEEKLSADELREQGRELKHRGQSLKPGYEQGRLYLLAARKFMLSALALEKGGAPSACSTFQTCAEFWRKPTATAFESCEEYSLAALCYKCSSACSMRAFRLRQKAEAASGENLKKLTEHMKARARPHSGGSDASPPDVTLNSSSAKKIVVYLEQQLIVSSALEDAHKAETYLRMQAQDSGSDQVQCLQSNHSPHPATVTNCGK